MSAVVGLANLVLRQAAEGNTTTVDKSEEERPACGGSNGYDGRMGLRISAVFVILIGSSIGIAPLLPLSLLLVGRF
jgi:zinc transporter 1/2/3